MRATVALAVLCLAVGGPLLAAAEPRPARRVVLVSIDTLRADHLGTYGYPRPTSPHLDAFAEKAVVFEDAMAQAPFTLPSHMSMLTGLEVWAHGVRHGDVPLRPSHTTLAEVMKEAGFATAAFVDGGFMSARYGFDQGFDEYHDDREPGDALRNGLRRYGDDVLRWIDERGDDPYFLFLHTFDTHGPYVAEPEHFAALEGTAPVVPPAATLLGDPMETIRSLGYHDYLQLERFGNLAELIDAYDATIRFVDGWLGGLFRHLEESGRFDDALVIVTSDHGESFMDHQLYVGHGLTLFQEEVHVPLLVKFPGGRFAGTRCADVVRSIDLLPTVARAAGLEVPSLVQGADLVRALEGRDPEPRIAAGVSPNLAGDAPDGTSDVTGYVRRGAIKLIEPPACGLAAVLANHLDREAARDRGEPYDLDADPLRMRERLPESTLLFDLSRDPLETTNLAPARPRDVARIQDRMRKDRERDVQLGNVLGAGATTAVLFESEEQLDDLFSQGYLSSDQLRRLKAELKLRREAAPPATPPPREREDG